MPLRLDGDRIFFELPEPEFTPPSGRELTDAWVPLGSLARQCAMPRSSTSERSGLPSSLVQRKRSSISCPTWTVLLRPPNAVRA